MSFDNFLSFATVSGFFIGLVISIIRFDSPEMIVIFTVFVTAMFHIIMLLSGAFLVKFYDFKKATVHKEKYDEMLEYYIKEFDKREKIADKIREFLKYTKTSDEMEASTLENKKPA